MVRRLYVEKKVAYGVEAKELLIEIRDYLGIKGVSNVRLFNRYDIESVSQETYHKALETIFSEPPVDDTYQEELPKEIGRVFSVEYLPGQFDQRADSALQCIKLLNEEEEPTIRTAKTYAIEGEISELQWQQIIKHCINPVDSRLSDGEKPETLEAKYQKPEDVKIFTGFRTLDDAQTLELYKGLGLAMTIEDFRHIQKYFTKEEKRDPSMTEIRVLDTYWSDHCRHTTFSTELTNIEFEEGFYQKPIVETYDAYKAAHDELFAGREDKFVCLMDMALMGMRQLKKQGKLEDQEESDEINACSIVVPIEIDGEPQEWLVSFKNETHNHPTEIEPFGGAATCLGGAIRDPLSGRSYVYQAMRVTGAADPRKPVAETLKGKLPQSKIVRSAAHGYSSYGNQIGLATGLVQEIYHPNYVAKRMEVGAVIGASPREQVIRANSDPGDIIVLLGGQTGRDGCGGATGSSKVHTEESIENCGAEVQKGNPPTERKIQRLFRRPEVSHLIKKCNDFGAGGVSVAIGELADGLNINLDRVPKKYAGLDGTEIAISESQERMAVVLDPKDVQQFLNYAKEENIEAVEVAVVTEQPDLILNWRGKEIVHLSRAFLDTNGAHQSNDVFVEMPKDKTYFEKKEVSDIKQQWLTSLADLNQCAQKGLVEQFDASIGAGSVFMPYGGKHQLTPTQSMVAKLPVLKGDCETVTMMSYGFNPYLSSWSPFHGAAYAIVESVSKIVAAGGSYEKIRFSFQEYFRRMTSDPKRYSQPVAALLGAYHGQMGFGLPAIGGKDSMSGTFNDIDVPPTLISFAVDVAKERDIITPELKNAGNKLVLFEAKRDDEDLPDYEQIKALYTTIHGLIQEQVICSAYSITDGGLSIALSKMAFGNGLGIRIEDNIEAELLFAPAFGSIIAEISEDKLSDVLASGRLVGEVTTEDRFVYKSVDITIKEALDAWLPTLDEVYPRFASKDKSRVASTIFEEKNVMICSHKIATPEVFIPVFPGTNCEYDSAKAFQQAGGRTNVVVFNNQKPSDIRESVEAFRKAISQAQILMLPGGFSAGDEPDGSAKFFATAFRNDVIKDEITKLIGERDGLVLGICNGFQALVKLGLVPYGEIRNQSVGAPTLTGNTIGRHISKMVYTKVVSNKSPWLQQAELGETYVVPASHGEGRFVASDKWLDRLAQNGQIATQYVDAAGEATMNEEWNINGSFRAIEGITSPDGRVFGKMAHAERQGRSVSMNIVGNKDMKLFESGIAYFN